MELEKGVLGTVLLTLLLAGSCSPLEEECDAKRQRRCRQNLVQELDRHASRILDDEEQFELHCGNLRANLNCLVLQVTRCPSPNRSGDVIQRTWKYLEDNCDAFGGWWHFECFHLEQVKKCEKIFALRDAAVSHASCREYDRFRHCIVDVVEKQCDPGDKLSMGNYLLDGAGDMIWTCPHQTPAHRSPMVDEGFVGVAAAPKPKLSASLHKKVLAPPLEKLDHPADPSLPVAVPKKSPSAVGTKIDVEESHLSGVYSSALTGNSPYVTGCNARATEEMRGCLDRHQYERDQALGAKDDEDRLRKECCATWNYRKCLQNAVRIHCYDTREVDIQSAVDVIPHDRGFLCRNHWIYTCSGAARPTATAVQIAGALVTALLALLAQRTLV